MKLFSNISGVFFLCLLCFVTKISSTPFANNCPNASTYTPNSTYKANLNVLLSALSANATSINGFFNFSVGHDSSDRVHGLFLCRGDVSTKDCKDCVATAVDEIVQYCPKEKAAILYYDNCLLRYSNQSFFSVLDQSSPIEMHNPLNNTKTDANRFRQALGKVMNETAAQAANNQSGVKFATKEANVSAIQQLYGLAQCTPDISIADCKKCLQDAISGLPVCCDMKQGGRYLFPSCNVRYELYPFYNLNATSTSPAPGLPGCPGKEGVSSEVFAATIVPVGVILLLLFVGFCFQSWKLKKKYDALLQEDTVWDETKTVQSLQYDLHTIQAATNNFSEDNKIGEGDHGNVYKGTLLNGQEIAVKKLSRNSGQAAEKFKNEVVLVAKFQHRNLVKLLGFCLEGEEKILIYEFVPNKSLDYFLFDPENQGKLDWSRRFSVIGGIARGILYLHEDSGIRIIHRNVKPSNILLDGDMNAKILDFGMTRMFGMDQAQGNMSKVVGTHGFISEEYVMNGQFSMKSDVFGFGVLVLEIVSGKKSSSFCKSNGTENILSYAWKLWGDGTPLELIDPNLEGSYSENEVTRCIHIALLCAQEDPNSRPSMATLVAMLNSDSVNLPVPQQPAFFPLAEKGQR